MVTWKQFTVSDPALAEKGERLLFQYGVGLAFFATTRADGAPRLHPLCPVLSNGSLYVLIAPKSPKRWDLLRDGRYALQTFPEAKKDSDEYYLSGQAMLVEEQSVFKAVFEDAKHFASKDEILFELMVDRVMHTVWEGFGTPEFRPVHTKWSDAKE